MRYRIGLLLCCLMVNGFAAASESPPPSPVSQDKLETLREAVEAGPVVTDAVIEGDEAAHAATRPNLRHLPPDGSVQAADARERAIGAAMRALLQTKIW